MTLRLVLPLALAALVGACSSTPAQQETAYFDEESMAPIPGTPIVEYPPIEPVTMPPPVEATPEPQAPQPAATPATSRPPLAALPDAVEPPAAASSEGHTIVAAIPPQPSGPSVRPEDLELVVLIADLDRYGALGPDEVKRELGVITQTFGHERTDANRVRLAVLYTLTHSPQDDLRALQLLDNVAKSGGAQTPVKRLAVVLQVQVAERSRAVRDEATRANEAAQKLEALRQMERSLLRDRISAGGGGGGGGAGGGGK
jgi:hypothetical protein